MKIVFVASEITPFASTGGLADVAGALPKAITSRGAEVCRVMPLYKKVRDSGVALRDTEIRFLVKVGDISKEAMVWVYENDDPITYFIEHDGYFDREQLYSLPDGEYVDNLERFVFFQKAVVALIDRLELKPDIVHCNDWQTGLIPYFLKHGLDGKARTSSERVIYTIHNLAYQGVYPGSSFSITGLPSSCFSADGMEFYGQVNCMKAGITGADMVTTVSKTYAQEIQSEQLGCGLDGALRNLGDRLCGIVNGVDYTLWNPKHDEYIAATYDPDELAGKRVCKEALLARMKLDADMDAPLIGMVSRLTDQKGLDLLAEVMPDIMAQNVRFALLGSGEDKYHALCKDWAARWPGKFAASLTFDVGLSHEIEAGSDLFMMPSRFEPCGLNQLYSLKYGTLPIVHATGGLEDTITDLNGQGTRGTGFKFGDYSRDGLLDAVSRALALYGKPGAWEKVVRRCMRQDFSWAQSAKHYLELYHETLEG